jgi:hypothetical protein
MKVLSFKRQSQKYQYESDILKEFKGMRNLTNNAAIKSRKIKFSVHCTTSIL